MIKKLIIILLLTFFLVVICGSTARASWFVNENGELDWEPDMMMVIEDTVAIKWKDNHWSLDSMEIVKDIPKGTVLQVENLYGSSNPYMEEWKTNQYGTWSNEWAMYYDMDGNYYSVPREDVRFIDFEMESHYGMLHHFMQLI